MAEMLRENCSLQELVPNLTQCLAKSIAHQVQSYEEFHERNPIHSIPSLNQITVASMQKDSHSESHILCSWSFKMCKFLKRGSVHVMSLVRLPEPGSLELFFSLADVTIITRTRSFQVILSQWKICFGQELLFSSMIWGKFCKQIKGVMQNFQI